jgi:hypothetical protein
VSHHPAQVQSWLEAPVSDLKYYPHGLMPDQKAIARMKIAGYEEQHLLRVAYKDNPRFEGWSHEARLVYQHEQIEKRIFDNPDIAKEAKLISEMKEEYHLKDVKNYDYLKRVEADISRMDDKQKATFKEQMQVEYEQRKNVGQEIIKTRINPELE